jgi:hypothetical protein
MDDLSAPTDRDAPGQGDAGRFRYVYTATGKTHGELLFAYRRSREQGESPLRTRKFRIVVK